METKTKNVKYVILANANGYKASRVVDILTDEGFLTSENCMVVTNRSAGKLVVVSNTKGINVLTISNKKLKESLIDYRFEFLISCGWNYIIKPDVLSMSSIASINCHSSYLPDYKGASAHKHAWANGETYTGATVHIMSPKFDDGNILVRSRLRIFLWDTPNSLIERIAETTACILPYAILKLTANNLGTSQKDLEGRYFFKTSNYIFFLLRITNILLRPFKKSISTRYKKV